MLPMWAVFLVSMVGGEERGQVAISYPLSLHSFSSRFKHLYKGRDNNKSDLEQIKAT